MRIAFFSAKTYERRAFDVAESTHDITYFDARLAPATAPLAEGHEAVCAFVSDDLSAETLDVLAAAGIRLVLLRSAGFNHIDLEAAERHGLVVARVPAYSPHAVAEHAVALALTLNRRLHRAHNRVREGNFELAGLLGVDLHGKTAGIVGTGRIGAAAAKILGPGFGMRLLVHDPYPNSEVEAMGASYVDIDTLLVESDLVSLHCPLTPESYHLLNASAFARMKSSAILVNTSRGGLVDTAALVEALKEGQIGAVALDVYEEEGDLFFQDLSDEGVQDDVFARLLTFPNALITGHQGFFTAEALSAIAETTLSNASTFADEGRVPESNAVTAARHTA